MITKTKRYYQTFQYRPRSIFFITFIFTVLLSRPDQSCSGIRLSDKRYSFDWEALINDEEAAAIRRLMKLQQYPLDDSDEFNDFKPLIRPTRKPKKIVTSDPDTESAIDRLSKLDTSHASPVPAIVENAVGRSERLQAGNVLESTERNKRRNDTLFLVIVGTCSLIGILGLVAAAIFWYKIQKRAEAAIDADYPSYGYNGSRSASNKASSNVAVSDRKLAQSAQMFHYQQQRQQMMAQEKAHLDARPVHSDDSDDEVPAAGDYTVYECPGLAPTGEMEVRNPLFAEPDTPYTSSTSHPTTNSHYPQLSNTASASSPPKDKGLSHNED